MGYEEIKLLKQSEKGTVHLVREQDGERLYIRKELKGRHSVYPWPVEDVYLSPWLRK